jgi:hypothetical protein
MIWRLTRRHVWRKAGRLTIVLPDSLVCAKEIGATEIDREHGSFT